LGLILHQMYFPHHSLEQQHIFTVLNPHHIVQETLQIFRWAASGEGSSSFTGCILYPTVWSTDWTDRVCCWII